MGAARQGLRAQTLQHTRCQPPPPKKKSKKKWRSACFFRLLPALCFVRRDVRLLPASLKEQHPPRSDPIIRLALEARGQHRALGDHERVSAVHIVLLAARSSVCQARASHSTRAGRYRARAPPFQRPLIERDRAWQQHARVLVQTTDTAQRTRVGRSDLGLR